MCLSHNVKHRYKCHNVMMLSAMMPAPTGVGLILVDKG